MVTRSLPVCLVLLAAFGISWGPPLGSAEAGEIVGNTFVNITNDIGAGVNTTWAEWSPNLCSNGLALIYSSDGPNSRGGWDLFLARRANPQGPFESVENLGAAINSGASEYRGEICADGKTLYFMRDVGGVYTLFVATRETWEEPFEAPPVPLSTVNGVYGAWGHSLSMDERTLFICSRRPGGLGGDDIWVSTRASTDDPFGFGEPVHFDEYFPGSVLNTMYDDWNADMTGDELAIVLSGGWESYPPGGAGGPDLLLSRRSGPDEPFGERINLNDISMLPVNSTNAEISPTIAKSWPRSGTEIFFISTRAGSSGGQDIWRATWTAAPLPAFTMQGPDAGGKVSVDASASTTAEGSGPMTFAWDFGDGTSGEWSTLGAWEKVEHTYAAPGRYPITLKVRNSLGVETTATHPVTVKCTASGDLAPWMAVDVGTPLFPGSAWKDGEDLHVCAGGTRLGGSDDEFHFVYGEATGDFDAVVQIEEVSRWKTGASIGLMARQSTASNSRYLAILVYRSSTTSSLRFRFRKEATASNRTGAVTDVPRWLMLSRRGAEVVAYSSADGSAWVEADRETIELPQVQPLLVGVAACGADPDDEMVGFVPLQARLSGLAIVRLSERMRRGDVNADGRINISDPVFNLNYQFARGAAPSCLKTADVNDDGLINLADPIFELNYLFASGPVPPIPLAECGADPTPDALTCESYPPCK